MDPATDQNPDSTFQREPQEVVIKREPEKEILVWTAPARPFKRRDRQFYVTTFSIAGIVALILFLAEGFMPVLLIISLVFLYYVLSTVEPEKVEYKITNKGIKIAGRLTEWVYLNRYWFAKRFDSELLVIETGLLPGRLELVMDPAIKEKLKKDISVYIPFEEVPASGIDLATNWLTQRLTGSK